MAVTGRDGRGRLHPVAVVFGLAAAVGAIISAFPVAVHFGHVLGTHPWQRTGGNVSQANPNSRPGRLVDQEVREDCLAPGAVSGFLAIAEREDQQHDTVQVWLTRGGFAVVNSVSCASAGNCAAGGSYADRHGHNQAFVKPARLAGAHCRACTLR